VVHKSSIYLPDELKQAIAGLAARSGRSEADLIRHALERLVTVAEPAAPTTAPADVPLVAHPRPALVGVGVGPGDPGMLTGRARVTLLAADRVFVITTDPRSVGRAEMVVRAATPTAPLQRLPFAIAGEPAARDRSLRAVAAAVESALDAGELVAVALLGDPLQWSIFPDLAAIIASERPTVSVLAEPGITSYQAAASAALVPLGHPGGAIVVVSDVEDLAERLGASDDAVVLYKATTDGTTLKAIAVAHGRDGAVVAELSGLPGQRIVALSETADGPISYLATVIFPARQRVVAGALSVAVAGASR
jgi:precorrin-2/cobalt-factor-2 C20-methyltransferase